MKFHIFGDLDAPDWILAEIITLGKLSPENVKLLSLQIIQHMSDGSFDYTRIAGLTSDLLDISDVRASISALHFFISNVAKFNVSDDLVSRELQQLGLPKDHCDSICGPCSENKQSLRKKLFYQTLRMPPATIDAWRAQVGPESCVILRLKDNKVENELPETFNGLLRLTPDKFRLLLNGLKQARSIMQEF